MAYQKLGDDSRLAKRQEDGIKQHSGYGTNEELQQDKRCREVQRVFVEPEAPRADAPPI